MPILIRSRRYDKNFWKGIKQSIKGVFDRDAAIGKLMPD
jgi:hypothetical protein